MFFKRIFKKPPLEPSVERLSLDTLRERVGKLRVEKLENIKPRINVVLDEIAKKREALLNELKALADASSSEEVHPRLMKTATEAKKLFVEKMTRALADIGHRPELSADAIAAFDGRLTKATNLIADTMVTHGRYVRTVFGHRFSAVQSCLRELHEMAEQAHVVIGEVIRENKNFDLILSEMESQMKLAQNVGETLDAIKSLEQRAMETEERLGKEKERLIQITSSEEFKRVTDSKQELDRIEAEMSRVEGEVVSAMSDLSRPLRKLERLVASGRHHMDRELIKTLELCINSPSAVLFLDEKIADVEALLREATKLLADGKIELDERERRKKLERIRELAASLRESKKRLERLGQELGAQKQAAAHPIQTQVAELEWSIGQREHELKQTKALVEELKNKSGLMEREIEGKRVQIEKLASEALNTKIELTS